MQQVTTVPAPMAMAGEDQVPLCGVTKILLAANDPAPADGTWKVISGAGGAFSSSGDPEALFSGQPGELYTLRWTAHNSPCIDATDDVLIKFSPLPTVSAGASSEIIEGETTILSGSGEGTLLWSPGESLSNPAIASPVASPAETTTYTLLATTADGCTDSDVVTINVLERLKIPTGISPNADGVNDIWVIEGVEDYPDISVRVFNRWGDEVYHSRGYGVPWDGSKNGRQLSDGVYYFVIDIYRGKEPYTGAVTVLR